MATTVPIAAGQAGIEYLPSDSRVPFSCSFAEAIRRLSPILNNPNVHRSINSRQNRLRIALVTSSLGRAGAEKQFFYVARALHDAEFDVRVVYFGTGGYYEKALRTVGIPVIAAHCEGRPLKSLAAVVRAVSSFRPHMVMAAQFGDAIHAGIAGRLCGALTVAGVRSDGFYEMNRGRFKRSLMRRLPHAMIANSFNARKNLVSLGIDAARIKVLQNVIDLRGFDLESSQPVSIPAPTGRILVAAIGRLHFAHKRFDRLLDAVARIPDTFPPVTVLFAGGDQGAGSALEQKARDQGLLPNRVMFLGESNNVPAILKRCDMLVLSSDYEGFPNVILEAMAARLPVVTTPAGDSPSLIEDGQSGYVVAFNEPGEMARRMMELAKSQELRRRMGEAGRHRVETEYDIRFLPERLHDLLSELACQQRRTELQMNLRQLHGKLDRILEHGCNADKSAAATYVH